VAGVAGFIRGVLELILVAHCDALAVLGTDCAGDLAKLFHAISRRSGLYHQRDLVNAHGMVEDSYLIKYVRAVSYERHSIGGCNRECLEIHAIDNTVETFIISHESDSASPCSANAVSIDTHSKVLPGVIF
jgi:hypothetical protein